MDSDELKTEHICETCAYWSKYEGRSVGICVAFGLETTEQGVHYITSYRSPNRDSFKTLHTDGDYGCIEWSERDDDEASEPEHPGN